LYQLYEQLNVVRKQATGSRELREELLGYHNNNRQPEIAIWSPKPEIFISLELWQIGYSVEIPTTNPGFLTIMSSIEVSASDCDNSGQHRELLDCTKTATNHFCVSVSVKTAWKHFYPDRREQKTQICRWKFDLICYSSKDISICDFGDHIAIFGCRPLAQSPGHTFFQLSVVNERA